MSFPKAVAIGFLALLLAPTRAFAPPELPGELPGERLVAWGDGASRQEYPGLVIADLPALHTRVLYSRRGMIPRGARGLVLLFPGTSGRVDSEYGIERSLAPLAQELLRQGYAVLAFQPPIYWLAGDPAARRPFLRDYGTLDGMLDWMLRIFELAESRLPRDSAGRPTLEMSGIFRSTFAALALEALHRSAAGNARFAAIRRLKRIMAIGIDGHTPEDIAAWHASERQFFLVDHPERGDSEVVLAAPTIFGSMAWQTRAVPIAAPGEPFPPLWVAVGSRDEFAGGRISELFRPVVQFSRNHPQLPISVAWHDGHHDPGRQVSVDGTVVAPTMARLRLILARFFEPPPASGTGLAVHAFPDADAVIAPLDDIERAACPLQLLVSGASSPPPPSRPRGRASREESIGWPILGPPWLLY